MAAFPFTIVAICGVGLAKRGLELLLVWESSKTKAASRRLSKMSRSSRTSSMSRSSGRSKQKSSEILEDVEGGEEAGEGITKIQKGALGFIWVASSVYAILTDKLLSKNEGEEVICSVRASLSEKLNLMSVFVGIAFPVLCLCLWPVGHLILDFFSCLKGIVIASQSREQDPNCCGDDSDSCIETILVFGFSIIFIVTYPTNLIIAELYFAEIPSMFPFMLLKYGIGSLHLVLSPACVLIVKRDIRKAAKDIYMKRSEKQEEHELTIKELRERLSSMGNVRFLFNIVFTLGRFHTANYSNFIVI